MMFRPAVHMVGEYRLHECPKMTIPGEPYRVDRTLRERLLTLPWRPFKATRIIVPQVPDPDVVVIKHLKNVYGHPDTIRSMIAYAKTQPESEVQENINA